MKIFSKITNLQDEYPNLALALGMFDGMHLGHQSIVKRAIELSKEIGGCSAALTFQNHPLSVIAKERMPLAIGSSELRAEILKNMGVDALIDIPFTKSFSKLSPKVFLLLLKENLAPKYVVVGKNYTFGEGGKGTGKMLIREGEHFGFKAEVCPTVLDAGKPISSTRIRALIKEGAIHEVTEFLGRPFNFIGRVVHGERRGRELGFPTANLKIEEHRAMFPNGVYAAKVKYDGKIFNALANIGNNPTFEGEKRRLEVHIENFSKNIYNELIEVIFLEKIREEKKFDTANDLVAAIRKDRDMARK
ncbi:MAG: bifunctional riboflavin kinase/FAD synthetase, partial [Selenomonadaceae bacterium]|nr:bifunctional riboflavin kinase/FAD synthetase [Selenomonadaceae bacterium]